MKAPDKIYLKKYMIRPGISECIKGTHKTAGGYIWKVIN